MFEGGQISEGGDKFPRKFGPGGTNFGGGHISCDTGFIIGGILCKSRPILFRTNGPNICTWLLWKFVAMFV